MLLRLVLKLHVLNFHDRGKLTHEEKGERACVRREHVRIAKKSVGAMIKETNLWHYSKASFQGFR